MADYSNPKASNAILGDLQEIVALIQAGAKMDPSGNTNIPNGAKRVVSVTGGYQIQSYNGTTWVSIGKLIHDCDTLDGKNTNTGTTANTIPVRDKNGDLPGDITGNAATATKLATARTIDLGGIASATEQTFDGSKPIVILINSINVNNEQDNAIVGVLTKAHGGTGRTDGAAADVVVSSAQGTVKASAYGQIGDAVNKTGTDLDTLTVTGNYLFRGGTVENHFPWDIPEASLTLVEVFRVSSHILQVLTYSDGQQWMRRSITTGASWLPWQCIKGRYVSSLVTIYVSKSGSDDNTGLDSAYPVQSINRAIEIAKGIMPNGTNIFVKLCVGEGDWGTVIFETLPFRLDIYPFDGVAATEYASSLPVFTQLSSYHSHVRVFGVVAEMLYAAYNGILGIASSYNRFAEVRADHGSCALFYGGTDYDLEVMAKSSHQYVLRAFDGSALLFTGSRTIRVVENLSISSFISCDLGSDYNAPSSTTVVLEDGVTVTGRKYSLQRNSGTSLSKQYLDEYPGSQDGTIENGTKLNFAQWGGGDEHTFMAADATWKKDSTSIYARDVAIDGDSNDLASARGQIGQAVESVAGNFDDFLPGTYWFSLDVLSKSTNVPTTAYRGTLVVYGRGNSRHQLFFAQDKYKIYYRFRYFSSATWTAWTEINSLDNPYPVFTGATSSAAGAKGLVPAPSAGSTDRFLSTDGTFKEATYLDNDIPVSSFKDALIYRNQAGSNRVAVIRVSNETVDGRYTISLGCNTLADDPAVGFDVSRDIETGDVFLTANGDLAVKGNLSITGTISGQNAFSTGDFVWSYASSKSGFLLCNGAAINRTTYANLYAIIGTKFGTGDGSTTFNLPDMRGRMAQGANGDLGSVLAAGLPNITGWINARHNTINPGGWGGALYKENLSVTSPYAQVSPVDTQDRLLFNASSSNSIYGASSTVQPPALCLNCFIKY